jgi:hypothetical protein
MKGTSRHSLMQEIGWEDMKLGVLSTSWHSILKLSII